MDHPSGPLKLPAGLRPALRALAGEAARRGVPAFAVGGCVRDWLLGLPTKDLDIVLESDPAPWARLCAARLGGRAEAFDRFGTFRVLAPGGLRLDFARARTESYSAPAALPVVRPATLRRDLERRDFAINAMAAPIAGAGLGALVDPLGGLEDLRRRVVRVLHPASFEDDPTRLYRAARFCARFAFRLEPATARLARRAVAGRAPGLLSRERLRAELWRILEEKDPAAALALARSWGLTRFWRERFRWPAGLRAAADPLERLILIALAMGPAAGADFVRSLNLERPHSQAALAALETARRRASPRAELPAQARAALERFLRKPKASTTALLVGGADLSALGLPPGPRFAEELDRAARAQWAGRFTTRAGALRWLRRNVL